GDLSGSGVLVGWRAGHRRVPLGGEEIIGDLKRLPDRVTKPVKCGSLIVAGLPEDRARTARKAQERACFHRLQDGNVALGQLVGRALPKTTSSAHIEHLPRYH